MSEPNRRDSNGRAQPLLPRPVASASASATAASLDAGPRRYSLDVRVFLAVVTASMACSFFAGVAFGPTPAELGAMGAAQQLHHHHHQQQQAALGGSENRIGGGERMDTASRVVLASTKNDDEDEDEDEDDDNRGGGAIIRQPRRLPTAHSAELGPRVRESHVNYEEPTYEDLGEGAVRRQPEHHGASGTKDASHDDDDDEEEEEHLPQGQHLLVDMKNVDHDFLNSESRLASAMVDVVKAGGLTLLSYHCHSLQPKGVSCVGVLLESHVSFHTWPDEGVITLDLFTCGPKPLLPVVPIVEHLFGVPRRVHPAGDGDGDDVEDSAKEPVKVLWSHELRGFRRPGERKKHYLGGHSDLARWVVNPLDLVVKKQVVSTTSKYQRIDIWDILGVEDTPSHQDAINAGLEEGDPRWYTYEVAKPERMLFLDGRLQSLSDEEREYHESLVHPALFAHPNPRRVAIVGGGEGAALREVLKHRTVEDVVMIEIDEELVEIAKIHLPSMSDCSNLEGAPASGSCFDDPRAAVVYDDGTRWFVDRFSNNDDDVDAEKGGAKAEFDVVILDCFDPEDERNELFANKSFLQALFRSLTPEGVVAIRIGAAPSVHDPRPDMGVYSRRERMFRLIESDPSVGAMFVYEEAHCGFDEPQSFLVVCKSVSCRKRWYAETDAVDFWIYERVVPTKGGSISLAHYDGATQRSFQIPPMAWETVYCRREPMPFECDYRALDSEREVFDFGVPPMFHNVGDDDDDNNNNGGTAVSSFEIKTLLDEEGEEYTAVFALRDIPAGSYIAPYDLVGSFVIRDDSIDNLERNTFVAGAGQVVIIEDFLRYVDYHGHRSMAEGSDVRYVEVGGTFMIRRTDDESDANVGRWMPSHPSGKIPVYSPVYERHMMSFDLFLVATSDIKKGEELMKYERLWD